MPEETKEPGPDREGRKAYQPPALVEYGSIVELTAAKNVSGTDLLPGARR
jgi:hypothetical protein